MGAHAKVLAVAERHVGVGLAGDVERKRIVEDVLVAVGGCVEQDERVPLGNRDAVHRDVFGGGSLHVVDRRGPAENFLDGAGHQRGVPPQHLELLGVLNQGANSAGQGILGGVVSSVEDDQVVAEGFHWPHGRAVDLAIGQHAGEIFGGVLSPVLDDGKEELDELLAEFCEIFRLSAASDFFVVGCEESVREFKNFRLLVPRDAQ